LYEEEEYRVRTNLHSGRAHSGRHSGGGGANKANGRMGLLGFQIAVCFICVAVAGVIKIAGGEVYADTRGKVSNALNRPVTSSQVKETLAAIKNGLPDVSGVFSAFQGASASYASSAAGSSGKNASAASSSGNSAALTQSNAASSSASASK
jgi:ribosomal protein L12E/L44/L45/RPP1/RPP2